MAHGIVAIGASDEDLAAAVTYVWLGQGLLGVVLLWGDTELSRRIRSGDVVVDLGRPWDLQLALLCTDLGRACHADIHIVMSTDMLSPLV